MPKLEYGHDARGSIILDMTKAPFDGSDVLVKIAAGWVEAWWDAGRTVRHVEVTETEGFCWVCLDDKFQAELDDVTDWLPLPAYQYEK